MILSIIIPAYNEENTISQIIDKVFAVELINEVEKEVIVINDGSSDKSLEEIKNNKNYHNLILIDKPKNQGKGAAINDALKIISGKYFIIQDADLEYDPEEFNLLLKPVIKNNADVVYGSRFVGGSPHRVLFFWHSIGNKFLTSLSNMFTDLNLTDMETCYKLIRTDLVKNFNLKEKRFGFEPEITAKISKIKKIKIYEVGISYHGRIFSEGKKINFVDGIIALWCILKYNLFN